VPGVAGTGLIKGEDCDGWWGLNMCAERTEEIVDPVNVELERADCDNGEATCFGRVGGAIGPERAL